MEREIIATLTISLCMLVSGCLIYVMLPPASLIQYNTDPKYYLAWFLFFSGLYSTAASAFLSLLSLKLRFALKLLPLIPVMAAAVVFYETYV